MHAELSVRIGLVAKNRFVYVCWNLILVSSRKRFSSNVPAEIYLSCCKYSRSNNGTEIKMAANHARDKNTNTLFSQKSKIANRKSQTM